MDKPRKNTIVSGPAKGRKNKKVILAAVIIILASVITTILLLTTGQQKKTGNTDPVNDQKTMEPAFRKDGELLFLKAEDENFRKKIDIEIAEDEPSRNRGLMFRHSMPDSAGMLFIFENSQPRSFWMENTYIPLDIIFADENMTIVTMQKNTVPFSKASVPSYKETQYVIEVNAGFSDNYGIKEGDKVTYERSK